MKRQPVPRPLPRWLCRAGGVTGLAFVAASCRDPEVRLTPLPSGAQAVSLLGDTLWNVPLPPGEGPALVALLHTAQRNLAVRPTDAASKLLVARRTAALGRLRDAVGLYNEVIAADFGSARVFRRRGDLLFQLREMAAAERDLRRSATDPTSGVLRDFSEDASGELVGSLVWYQATISLGVVQYVGGDYGRAATSLLAALKTSEGADELAESGLWLSFALRRAGRLKEAAQVIRGIPGNLAVQRRVAELTLLRLFRGDIGLDSVRLQAVQGGPENEALFLYGLGFVQLARADTAGAAETLQQILDLGNWPSRAFIAAEADLARIRLGRKPRR